MASVDRDEPHVAEARRRLFGTDGIRGVANAEPVTCETAVQLGRAIAQHCGQQGRTRPRIVVGKDTRVSGDMLESALVAGICSAGGDALLTGILPTPGIAFLTRTLAADAGAVVSASHNPFADNGIKLFASTGFKLSDDVEEHLESMMCSADALGRPSGAEVGRVAHVADAARRYSEFLQHSLPHETNLRGLKVAIDCAHGAAAYVGPEVFTMLGATVVAIGVSPDGTNINRGAGAMHPQRLQETVVAEHAHLGIALDGDADRLICVDESGVVVDGDEVLAMAAADMMRQGTLRQATVVATVMSNLGLEVALRECGARLVRVQVGDRYVVEEMVRGGCNLGGEQSGHLLFLDHATTGDGLLGGLTVARLVMERQRPLSELKRVMTKFPQVLLNVRVARRAQLEDVTPIRQTLDRIRGALADRGRVLVRYSGTEPVVRVMVEGEQESQVQAYAEDIAAAIRAHVGT